MRMRDLIDLVEAPGPFTANLFHGSDNPEGFGVDSNQGTTFASFDEASSQGRYVFACRIVLDRPMRARSEEELAEMLPLLLHGAEFDGCVFDAGGVRKVITRDPAAVEIHERHDAKCDLDEVENDVDAPLLEFVPDPGSRIVLVTGQLASAGVERVMEALGDLDFTFEVRPLDVAVAAWLTTERIADEIGDLEGVAAVVIPGKTGGEDAVIEARHGVKVLRGPACYSQLPTFFERQGIEIPADGIVRPKLVMLGGDAESARMLAATYEVPLLDVDGIIASLGPSDPLVRAAQAATSQGQPIPHNVKAEIVRSRMFLPDVANGFVLLGYPETARDAVWFDEFELNVDAIIAFDDAPADVLDHYRDAPALLIVDGDDRAADLYRGVEGRLRRCVVTR